MVTSLLLFGLAVARALDAPELITGLGRSEARSTGVYEGRRAFQAAVVVAIGLTWCVSVAVAVWRVPERRRRYLPAVIVTIALVAFAAVRVVSLHHIDQILYNRPIHGIRVVVFIELGMLAVLTGLAIVQSSVRSKHGSSSTDARQWRAAR